MLPWKQKLSINNTYNILLTTHWKCCHPFLKNINLKWPVLPWKQKLSINNTYNILITTYWNFCIVKHFGYLIIKLVIWFRVRVAFLTKTKGCTKCTNVGDSTRFNQGWSLFLLFRLHGDLLPAGILSLEIWTNLSASILVTCSSHSLLLFTHSFIGWIPQDSLICWPQFFSFANYFS